MEFLINVAWASFFFYVLKVACFGWGIFKKIKISLNEIPTSATRITYGMIMTRITPVISRLGRV